MQGIVGPEERAEFEPRIMRLAMGISVFILERGLDEVYLLPTVLGQLDTVVWCGLMDVAIF